MAVFDRDSAKLVVRVVYDGPGNAGKTTNLIEMCHFFTPRRRSELVSPESLEGRTLWFDWLQIEAGLVAGYGLRCQIVTVPGQVVLRRRRGVLLRAADVIVLVCDSTPAGIELVRPAFGRIRQFIADQPGPQAAIRVPIVVQANKQDLPGALPPERLAAELGTDPSIPIIAARANSGIGVKETLVLAIRAAANRAQQLVLERGIDALAGEPDAADTVLAELRRLDDGSPLEDLMDHQSSADERAAAAVRMPAASANRPRELPVWWPMPPIGDAAIAPGNLWPAATGREVLRGLASTVPRPRLDLVAQHGDHDGSGKTTTVIYDAEGWCLKTSSSRRFEDVDAARFALVKLARTKIALGALTLTGTILVAFGDPASGYWVWTFAPWRRTLRGEISDAIAAGDSAAIGDALVRFASAVTEACVRALRTGHGLDLHPSNFASDGDALIYLDDEVTTAPPLPGAAHAILQRGEELASYPAEIERYAASLIAQIAARLSRDDLARLRLVEGLRTTPSRAATARQLRAQLLAALDPDAVAEPPEAPAETVAEAVAGAVEAPPELEPPAPDPWPRPPITAENLPSGYIWPVVAGRELVRQIFSHTPTRRDGWPYTYELGDYVLSTSSERRFAEVDDARAELLRLARVQVARGTAGSGVVLMLAPDDVGGVHWIWTLAPAAGGAPAAT